MYRFRGVSLALVVSAISLAFAGSAGAQEVENNVNVLPIYPGDYLKGDLYLQRQNEPSLAVSSVNPQHVVAFFNDYRAVDIPNDVGLGESSMSASSVWSWVKGAFAKLLGRPSPEAQRSQIEKMAAGAEGWIGVSRSADGGVTWSGAFLPGSPWDGTSAPIKGYAGATDPVVAAAPCGYFHVALLAFTRGAGSAIAVARYRDYDDSPTGDSIRYEGMTIIETGNNASNGYFLDKPDLDVFVAGGQSGCAHSVGLTYTTFNGLSKDGKVQTKVNFAKQTFDGTSTFSAFSAQKVSDNWGQGQGTALAVDPTDGNNLYVFFRHFFSPNTVVMTKSTTGGSRWSKPVSIIDSSFAMQPADQPSGSYDPTAGRLESALAFRSNSFPTGVVTVVGTQKRVFAAWQERWDRSGNVPGTGLDPTIVITRSDDGGTTWKAVDGAASPSRKAADVGTRPGEMEWLGFARPGGLPAYGQVMPRLSFGGEQLMLGFYEARGPGSFAGYLSGRGLKMDARGALLNPLTGQVVSSFQVSRYPMKPDSVRNASNGNSEGALSRMSYPNEPQSKGGTTPFMGDYIDVDPVVSWVPNGSNWKRPVAAADMPFPGFRFAFADNRNLVPAGTLPAAYGTYPSCTNPGSRNTDVMTARVSLGLVVTGETAYKKLKASETRTFPMTVFNNTPAGNPPNVGRYFKLEITTVNASFDPDTTITSGVVYVYPFSGSTQVVYVPPGTANNPVRVSVTEVGGYKSGPNGGLTGRIAFNEANHPCASATCTTGDTHGIIVDGDPANPLVENPLVENPLVENPFVENPLVENPFVENPLVENAGVQDVTWTVYPTNDTQKTAAYSTFINIDKAYWPYYRFQLIVWKPTTGGVDSPCVRDNGTLGTVLASYYAQNPLVENPLVENPFVENPFVENPFVENPFVENSAFAVAPPDTATSGTSGDFSAYSERIGTLAASDGTVKAPLADPTVKITLRAIPYCVKQPSITNMANCPGGPGFAKFDPTINPPSLTIAEKNCVTGTPGCALPKTTPSPNLTVNVSGTALGTTPDPEGAPKLGPVVTTPVPAGTPVRLVNPIVVKNDGTADAPSGIARRHFYFLVPRGCTLPSWGKTGGDTMPACALKIAEETLTGTLAKTSSEALLAAPTIPVTVAPGYYRLAVYADGPRTVSELTEKDNWAVSDEFQTVPPYFSGILGLFSPCGPSLTCTGKAGNNAVPLAYQFTYDNATAVDTGTRNPVMRFYNADRSQLLAEAAPNNVSSGNSGWQYFDASCLPVGTTSCPRQAYTWQYNWKPVTASGAQLPAGTYLVDIETPDTKQCNPSPPLTGGTLCPTDGSAKGPVATLTVTLTSQ